MKNILIMLGLCMIMLGCGDNYCANNSTIKDKKLTAETRNGANTMSCKIDGQVWVANGINDKRDNCLGIYYHNSTVSINGFTKQDCARMNGYITLFLDTSFYTYHNGVKRYAFGSGKVGKLEEKYNNASVSDLKAHLKTEPYVLYTTGTAPKQDGDGGWVEITRYDENAKIISGRFECVVYPPTHLQDSIPPVRITVGRFDINYGVDFYK